MHTLNYHWSVLYGNHFRLVDGNMLYPYSTSVHHTSYTDSTPSVDRTAYFSEHKIGLLVSSQHGLSEFFVLEDIV
jgi:hypothetical protein